MEKVLKNYTLGRGKVKISRFKPGTQVPAGFLYIGNTPQFSLTIESEDLAHTSSDEGVREQDDSVTLEITRTGSFTTDNISPANVALFFFGDTQTVAVAAATGVTYTIEGVEPGLEYFVGATLVNPVGVKGIDPADFVVGTAGGTKASGTITIGDLPLANDTNTVGSVVYTWKTGAVAAANEVLIGADEAASAANLAAAINAGAGLGVTYGTGTVANPDVTASVAAAVVTVLAKAAGTGGNAIVLEETGAGTTVSGATLTGGSGTPAEYTLGTDYNMNFDTGLLEIIYGGAIPSGEDLEITYSARANSRSRVISGNAAVEGALIYEANNPKGRNFDYYMGYVQIRPNGDYELKGDEWQSIPFNLSILKPNAGGAAILMDGRPAYA